MGSGNFPTREECLALLRKHDCPKNVIAHILVVEKVAVAIASRVGADIELVSAGALLHDIGRSRTHDTFHLVEGARILEEEKIHPKIIHIVQRHMGAGVDEEDRILLGFPSGDYVPHTLEEKVVAHSDTLLSDTMFGGVKLMASRLREHGFEKAAKRVLELHNELSELAGVDLDVFCKEVLTN